MRSGVSTPLYVPSFSVSSPDADFPAENLADLADLTQVCLTGGTISFTLPAAVPIGLVAVCHHNAAPGATMQVTLGSDVGPTVAMNAPGVFLAHTPYCPAAPVTADAGTITLSAGAWAIGGVVIGGFWGFTDVTVDREIGVVDNDSIQALLGADHATRLAGLRTLSATRAISDVSDQDLAMDFLKATRGGPFVWVWDADDPTTWAAQCWLARTPDPAAFTKLNHPYGQAAFKLTEHLG